MTLDKVGKTLQLRTNLERDIAVLPGTREALPTLREHLGQGGGGGRSLAQPPQ